jgi:hypothetical protein
MLGSRRGRPSLIGQAAGTAARTAVIAKTATAVTGSSAAKQQQKMHAAELAHAERMAAVAPAAAPAAAPADAPAAPAAPVAGGDGGLEAAIRALASAHDAGVLDDAEFAAKVKARLG